LPSTRARSLETSPYKFAAFSRLLPGFATTGVVKEPVCTDDIFGSARPLSLLPAIWAGRRLIVPIWGRKSDSSIFE
jgi:hypothetical protein